MRVSDNPKNKVIRIRVTDKELEDITIESEKRGISISELIRLLIDKLPKEE